MLTCAKRAFKPASTTYQKSIGYEIKSLQRGLSKGLTLTLAPRFVFIRVHVSLLGLRFKLKLNSNNFTRTLVCSIDFFFVEKLSLPPVLFNILRIILS